MHPSVCLISLPFKFSHINSTDKQKQETPFLKKQNQYNDIKEKITCKKVGESEKLEGIF